MNCWGVKMSKKYYYDCPIKAAYMNHEFGVITYVELSIKSEIYEYFIKDWNHRELKLDPKEKHYRDKYYVAKESEHIFEPKERDKDENGLFFDGRHWTYGVSYAISSEQSKTSFRFGKQFFMPEVEND